MEDTKRNEPTGRDAVRTLLIDRLTEAGLQRPRGVSAAAHDGLMRRLVDQLCYMTSGNLETLAETLIDAAQDGRWPSEVVVRNFARGLQDVPTEEKRIVRSWFASVEGPQAIIGGYEVELLRFLLQHGRPPLAGDMRELRERSADNARRCELIRGRIERETVTDDDRRWLAAYEADRRRAHALIDAGRNRQEAAQ